MSDPNAKSVKNVVQSTSLGAEGIQLDPSAYIIKNLDLFPHKAIIEESPSWNLIPQLDSLAITESIYNNAVFVNIHVIDSVGIFDTIRISGGEKIYLLIEQEVMTTNPNQHHMKIKRTKSIELELYISDITNFKKQNNNTQTFTITCVPRPAYINQLIVLNRAFSGTPGQEIENIVTSSEIGGLGLEINKSDFKNLNEGYGKAITGIYPKLKPFDAINWLLQNASKNGAPIFFYESLKDGYQLKYWEDMLDQDDWDTYNNYPHPLGGMINEKGERITLESPDYYDTIRKIMKSINSTLRYSLYNDARKGAYASHLTSVDISNKNYSPDNKFQYKKGESKGKGIRTLNEYKPFSTTPEFAQGSLDNNHDSRNFFISENKYAFKDANNYHADAKENLQKIESYRANMGRMQHNFTLPGDPDLTAGIKVKLKIWKIQDPSREDLTEWPDGDLMMGGMFIISKIIHMFRGDGYTMELTALKDSSAIDLDEEFKIQ